MPWRIWPKAASLAMNTMAPEPAARMGGIATWVQAMAVKKLISTVRCHLARSVSSARKPGTLQPALLTSTSMPPQWSSRVGSAAFQAFGRDLARLFGVDVGDDQAGTFGGEAVHDPAADVGRAAGDQIG